MLDTAIAVAAGACVVTGLLISRFLFPRTVSAGSGTLYAAHAGSGRRTGRRLRSEVSGLTADASGLQGLPAAPNPENGGIIVIMVYFTKIGMNGRISAGFQSACGTRHAHGRYLLI